ncbi:MAG: peptide deformylase [Spirochaetaceae bacterium]
MLPIVTIPDPVLRLEAKSVTDIDASIRSLTDQMFESLEEAQGLGLAAPQVGRSLQLFIVYIKTDMPRVFINPAILETSLETTKHEEGCLSIPGVYADVLRPEAVQVQAWNEKGKPFSLSADGLLARVILHEYDHLKGVLFPDYLPKRRREKIWSKFETPSEVS